jgi:septal ring factor EnvC (AmiA/AmiB activator)
MTGASTRQLASAPLEVVSDRRARTIMRTALVAVLIALAAAVALRLYAGSADALAGRDQLRQQNSALQADVARLEAELELERATRTALDAQVAELNRRIADLDRELAFVHAQAGRPRRAGTTN